MTTGTNELLDKPIKPLLLKYAIPSVISMLINSIYNIVDQIFLGWGVGYLGNTATNIALPYVTLNLAVSLLIAVGCSSYMNLAMGRNERDSASRAFGSAILLGGIFSVALGLIGIFFARPMAYMFGATETSMSYAIEYMRIISVGVIFTNPTTILTNAIRADGNPNYSMIATMTGAILNCILDPLFIFVFKWGVAGAAWATVIGQIVSFILTAVYINKFKNFDFGKKYLTLKCKEISNVLKQGSSSFVLQLSNVIVQVVMNNSLRVWGAQSIYGSDICLAALGITMKVNMIFNSIVLGFAIGQQPIIGFNYGAKSYKRAFDTFKFTTLITVCISLVGWLLFQLAPNAIISIFGQESELYNEFATMCLQIYLGAIFCAGFLIPTSHMFQAIGKPNKSVILTLLRQFVIIIPLLLILPRFMGVNGLLYAGLITDVVSFVFSFVFVMKERKEFNGLIAKMQE